MLTKAVVLGMALLAGAGPVWAQGNEEKKTLTGPSATALGPGQVLLPDGAKAEVECQPATNRMVIKTTAKDAQLITSARFLVIVENEDGTVDVTLANGRKVSVKPENVDIFGRAIVDDPGQILLFVRGSAIGTVATDIPAAALSGLVTSRTPVNPVTGPRPETSSILSPSAAGNLGFGQ
jgi:hypothetical protein